MEYKVEQEKKISRTIVVSRNLKEAIEAVFKYLVRLTKVDLGHGAVEKLDSDEAKEVSAPQSPLENQYANAPSFFLEAFTYCHNMSRSYILEGIQCPVMLEWSCDWIIT